jgi:hypothetical protein
MLVLAAVAMTMYAAVRQRASDIAVQAYILLVQHAVSVAVHSAAICIVHGDLHVCRFHQLAALLSECVAQLRLAQTAYAQKRTIFDQLSS